MRRGLLILILLLFAAAVPGAQSVSQKQAQFDIEHELERLPTYGVFDFIGFNYDRGKVSLVGYAYQGGLKSHAANAVKRVAGVDEVDNEIDCCRLRCSTIKSVGRRSTRFIAIAPCRGIHPAVRWVRVTNCARRAVSLARSRSASTRFTSSSRTARRR